MKPKINQKVYIIYQNQIYEETVGYLGEHSFIINFYDSDWNSEYEYDDYNKVWFRSLEKAKKELLKKYKKYGCKVTIEQINQDTWEVIEDE